eukprot:TRINITY_DN4550_c0_g1_i1.p1 TRINITY_DN4550_c0_g1~~TRINITY_DN4550_c0_g1_i1.p1  ORF type:complete len:377 (-),score=63.92 TRINITY_DN4550_c0_g1_i1:54-1184(-)
MRMEFFFFKQKTAYEIKECDWSSDVCSPICKEDLNEELRFIATTFRKDWKNVKKECIEIQQVSGGITNRLFRLDVNNPDPQTVLIRIFGEKTEILINRALEQKYFHRLSDYGEAPTFYGTFNNGAVYGYAPGCPVSLEELDEPTMQANIATTLGRWHNLKMPGPNRVNVFHTLLNNWILSIPTKYDNSDKQNLLEAQTSIRDLLHEVAYLESVLTPAMDKFEKAERSEGFTADLCGFCHMDLLNGNLIFDKTTKDVTFIDYEYATKNPLAYDIANHFCEYANDLDWSRLPSEESQNNFLTAYLKERDGSEPSSYRLDRWRYMIQGWMLVSHYYWGTWALVQAAYSAIDFDFLSYGLKRVARAQLEQDSALEALAKI